MASRARTIGLLAAMAMGISLPAAATLTWLVQYLIMFMLFYAFLEVEGCRRIINLRVFGLVVANLAIAAIAYLTVRPFGLQLALAAFMAAISPTATAAPVVVGFLGGEVGFAVAAVLITNCGAVLILPLFAALLDGSYDTSNWNRLTSVLVTIVLPLAAAQALRQVAPKLARFAKRGSFLAFQAWLAVLFLTCASASRFMRTATHHGTPQAIVGVAILSLVLCVVNFVTGYLIGRPRFGLEASQSLGQKNTMLTVWFSLAFFSPFVALGPTFYMLFHNFYNSFQLARCSSSSRIRPLRDST